MGLGGTFFEGSESQLRDNWQRNRSGIVGDPVFAGSLLAIITFAVTIGRLPSLLSAETGPPNSLDTS
jgi:hypothetical protein